MTVYGDSYCGIYCGACSVRRYGETSSDDGFIACCGSVPKKELACGGCKSNTLYTGCRICGLRDCALDKGVEHCIDCADYPCKMYDKWQSAAKFLPHVHEASLNLEVIKRDGTNTWVEAQNIRWSCPNCGALFSWYATVCDRCGHSLTAKAYTMAGLRKLICRIVLPMVYKRAKRKISHREHKGE